MKKALNSQNSLNRKEIVSESEEKSVPLPQRTRKSYTDGKGNYHRGLEEELADIEAAISGGGEAAEGADSQSSATSEGARGDVDSLRRQAALIRAEIARREQLKQEFRKKYNISEKGDISLDDLSRLFHDLNSNKAVGELFDNIRDVLKKLGTDFRFTDRMDGVTGGVTKGTYNIDFFNWDLLVRDRDQQDKAGTFFHEMIHNISERLIQRYEKPFHDMIDDMFGNPDFDKATHSRERYDLGDTPEFMKKLGITGDNFSLSFKNIKSHLGKDSDHNLTAKEWHELPDAIKRPFLITSYGDGDGKFRLYTSVKVGNKFAVVGIDVVKTNQGKDKPLLDVNRIKTVFGRDRYVMDNGEKILAYDEKMTPEQEALLRGHNFREYPSIQELSSGGKDTKNNDTLQENQQENAENREKSQENENNSLLRQGKADANADSGAKKTAKQQRERKAFAERQWRRAHDVAKEWVEKLKLGDVVTVVDSVDEVPNAAYFKDVIRAGHRVAIVDKDADPKNIAKAVKDGKNINSTENYSNIANEGAESENNELPLPNGWDRLPTNDIDNKETGDKIKGLKTLLNENYQELLKAYSSYGNSNRGSLVGLQQAREALRRELDLRDRKIKEWSQVYNIKKDGQISLEDLSRLFHDHNRNKDFDKLFEKVAEVAQIGLDIQFDEKINAAGSSNYNGQVRYNTDNITSSG